MLAARRHFFALLSFLLLATPLATGIVHSDKLNPDEISRTPVERSLVCWPGQRPKNFSAVAARADEAPNYY